MKAILEFTLPEEQEEFEHAQKGWQYLGQIEEFDNWLRGQLKYCELDEKTAAAYELCRKKLRELAP